MGAKLSISLIKGTDEIHSELRINLSKSHWGCKTRLFSHIPIKQQREHSPNRGKSTVVERKKLPMGTFFFWRDVVWWSAAFKRPQWPSMIGNGHWLEGLTVNRWSVKVNGQCIIVAKRYWITCKTEELSDWLEDTATHLDWVERKTRWLRLREGCGEKSWKLRGDDSPRWKLDSFSHDKKNQKKTKRFLKCHGGKRCTVRKIKWG